MKFRNYQLNGINLKVSPFLQNAGDLLRAVNVDSIPYGAKKKRPGYVVSQAGSIPNGSQVADLVNFYKNNGTQFWNYAFAGGVLYYSQQGTGAWTVCGNGTFNSGGTLTHAVLEDTLYVCDGVGTICFSANGTSFVNNGTALIQGFSGGTQVGTVGSILTPAPVAVALSEYHQRLYAAGTASNLFWSNTGFGTDWTNDSSSVLITGKGKLNGLMKSQDRLIATKNSGVMFRWDDLNLLDLATNNGPKSMRSIGTIQGQEVYLNQKGFYTYDGNSPSLISNPIEPQIYNQIGSGIIGTTFSTAPATVHLYDYYCTIGTVTDDITGETVNDAIAKYNFIFNEWTNYSFANRPTAWLSYIDNQGNYQLMFGAGNGQTYQMSGTATSDAGSPITTVIEGVLNFDFAPDNEEQFKYLWAFFNPGAQAHVAVAVTNTFTREKLNWIELGDCSNGIAELRFPQGSRGRLLMYKIYETSATDRFNFYGFAVEASPIDRT